MTYSIKYLITYKKTSGVTTTIQILEKDYGGGTTTLMADGNPLEIMISGDVTDLYCGTVGSGANINLRITPLSMINLFTTDPQKYMVKVFADATLIWQGFINTGIYYEDLNSNKNTLLSLKANDGMAILDMIPYRLDSSTYYSGITHIGDVLTKIMSKLNLSFNDRWSLMDFRVTDYAVNVLLYLKVNQENYIDESGVPMTCREVLNSIMKSFGLRMSFRGDVIYIIDPIILHTKEKGQQLNAGWGDSITTFPGGYLDISTRQISWYQTGVSLDIIPPINQLDVKYDPYTFTGATLNLEDSANWYNVGSFTGPSGLVPNRYYINKTIQFKNTTVDGSILQQAIKREDGSEPEYYFKLQKKAGSTGNPGIARISFPFSTVSNDSNISLNISADYYTNTRDFDNIYDTSIASDVINYIETSLGYRFGGGPDSSIIWKDVKIQSDYTLNGATMNQSAIQDNWFTVTKNVNITGDGSLNVFIWGKFNTGWYTTKEKNVLVKNIKVDVVDSLGNNIENKGQKCTALKAINDYVITPTEISLQHGTGPYGTSKGAYIDYLRDIVSPGIYRGLDPCTGNLYPNSYHVAQSFVSQYSSPKFVLKGDLNVRTHLLDTQNYLIQWSNYLPNKSFFIANGTYNDKYEYMTVEMVECVSTRDNITIS